MKNLLLLSLSLALSAGTAAQASKADPKSSNDRMICREVAQVGTRLGKRVCLSKSDWDGIAEEHRAAADRAKGDGAFDSHKEAIGMGVPN